MNIDRRSGAPSAFTWLLGLTLGATCAAMTAACSASSGTAEGGWGQSGGGPLGGGTNNGASSGGTDASTSNVTPGSDAAAPMGSSGGGSDAGTSATGDAAMDGVADGSRPGDAAGEGSTNVPPDFTLLDTAITGVIQGSPVAGFDPIAEGATINLAEVGTALSVRANTLPAVVGSVAFALDATYTHTENTAPYALCGDDGAGTITSCAAVLTVGKHTLTATPYTAASLGGDAGAPILLDFTIVNVPPDAGGDAAGIQDAAGQ